MPESRKMTTQIDCWENYHHKWLESQKILSVEELETLLTGAKPKDTTASIAWKREAQKEKVLNNPPCEKQKWSLSIRSTLEL